MATRSAPTEQRPQPDQAQALDAEAYVVAAAMASETAYRQAARLVNASAFWKPAHEAIWRAIAHLRNAGEPCDPVLVSDRMRVTQESINYIQEVPRIFDLPWTPANVVYLARLIARAATKRAAHQAAVSLAQASTLADHDAFRTELGVAIDRLIALVTAWDGATK